MKNRTYLFLICYSIAALLTLIGLNVCAYTIRKTPISEEGAAFLRAVSCYNRYFRQPDVSPNPELESAVQNLEKYRKSHLNSNSGEMLLLVFLSQKYLESQPNNTAAAQKIYDRMVELAGKDKKQTIDLLIEHIDRFNRELDGNGLLPQADGEVYGL